MKTKKYSKSHSSSSLPSKKKGNKKKYLVLGFAFFFIFLMVGSVLVYYQGDNTNDNLDYNGYKFTLTQQGYVLDYNDKSYVFYFHPRDLEMISSPDLTNFIELNKFYVAEGKDIDSTYSDLMKQVFLSLGKIGLSGCLDEDKSDKCLDLPILSCDKDYGVIIFENSDTKKIEIEENCVTISGNQLSSDPNDALFVTHTLFIYKIMGVVA